MPRSHSSLSAAILVGLLCASLAAAAAAPKSKGAVRSGASAAVRCTGSTEHPIRVTVSTLDAVARGAVVRLIVGVSSAVPLDQVEAHLISSGGASNLGPSIVALGELAPRATSRGVFTLAIPSAGGRQYVQFQIVGKGPQGNLSRGACYNLLPDGPAQVGRLVVTPQGARVLEVGARRID